MIESAITILRLRQTGKRLAEIIKEMRLEAGMSQAQLAKRINTTQSRVAQIESPDYGRFTIATLIDVARVFDYEVVIEFRRRNK